MFLFLVSLWLVLNIKLDYVVIWWGKHIDCSSLGVEAVEGCVQHRFGYFLFFKRKHCGPVVWNCFLCGFPVILVRELVLGPTRPPRSMRTFHRGWLPLPFVPSWLVIVCVLNADGHVGIELAYLGWCVRQSLHTFGVFSHWVGFARKRSTRGKDRFWMQSLCTCLSSRPQSLCAFCKHPVYLEFYRRTERRARFTGRGGRP